MIINEEQDDSKEGKTQTNEKKYFQNQRWDSQSYLRTTNDQYFVYGHLTMSVIKSWRLPYCSYIKNYHRKFSEYRPSAWIHKASCNNLLIFKIEVPKLKN